MGFDLFGGKLPTRLLQDLKEYAPAKLPPSRFNVLTQVGPQFLEERLVTERLPAKYCLHSWVLKPSQSLLPLLDTNPPPNVTYICSLCCRKCRQHASVQLSAVDSIAAGIQPCDQNLHHFLFDTQIPTHPDDARNNLEQYRFRCSVCKTLVGIAVYTAQIDAKRASLFFSPSLIRVRAESVIKQAPDRFEGHAIPSPTDVLCNLKAYIQDAKQKKERRPIQAHNKRFALTLGEPARGLLQLLGFRAEEGVWHLPEWDHSDRVPFSLPQNIFLDDVETELSILISQQPPEDLKGNPAPDLRSADEDLLSLLNSRNYDRVRSRRNSDGESEEHPYYAGLGVTGDVSDEVIKFAYEKQDELDLDNSAYYLECLGGIARGRGSETLQVAVAMAHSNGRYSSSELVAAYQRFGLNSNTMVDDEKTIIGIFHARLEDSPRQEDQLRADLRLIGLHRESQLLLDEASGAISTAGQAYAFFDAPTNTDDEGLITLRDLKVGDNPALEQKARRCVEILAEHRNSSALRRWLNTGVLGPVEMSVDKAYSLLGISNHTVDDDMVLASYQSAIADAPGREQELARALQIIGDQRNSTMLPRSDKPTVPTVPRDSLPVGLNNIGNTCYLNSLLQYLFTIKPLRELVLNFEKYKHDLSSGTVNKKVGRRIVTLEEVQRSQDFVERLRELFQSMIHTPEEKITPLQELARLTLVGSAIATNIRRRSTITDPRPALDATNLAAIPTLEPVIERTGSPNSIKSTAAEPDQENIQTGLGVQHSNSSQVTLVTSDKPEHLQNEEQTSDPMVIDGTSIDSPLSEHPSMASADGVIGDMSHHNAMQAEWAAEKSQLQEGQKFPVLESAEVEKPPPIPPRTNQPAPAEPKGLKSEIEASAQQQDVNEVITNVLFQLECAIKPDGLDDEGEQLDLVKQVFFGKTRHFIRSADGKLRQQEEDFTDIMIDISARPTTLYAALEKALIDETPVEIDSKGTTEQMHTTISKAPLVLQVMIQRAHYDRVKQKSVKITNHVAFDEELFIDRFIDTHDEDLLARRETSRALKAEIADLEKEIKDLEITAMNLSAPDALNFCADYLDDIQRLEAAIAEEEFAATYASKTQKQPKPVGETSAPIDTVAQDAPAPKSTDEEVSAEVSPAEPAAPSSTEVVASLRELSTVTREKLHAAELRLQQITSQLSEIYSIPAYQRHRYRLQSVFIHRGSDASFGHYWIYIRDYVSGIWRKYNDDIISTVEDVREIFEDGFSRGQPNLLVYVRDDIVDDPKSRAEGVTLDVDAPMDTDNTTSDLGFNLSGPITCTDIAEALHREIIYPVPLGSDPEPIIPDGEPLGTPTQAPTGAEDTEMKQPGVLTRSSSQIVDVREFSPVSPRAHTWSKSSSTAINAIPEGFTHPERTLSTPATEYTSFADTISAPPDPGSTNEKKRVERDEEFEKDLERDRDRDVDGLTFGYGRGRGRGSPRP